MVFKVENAHWQGSQPTLDAALSFNGTDNWLDTEGQQRARYRFTLDVTRGKDVLEIGCGSGHGSIILLKGGARSLTGVDPSPEAIESARQHSKAPNLHYQLAELHRLPFSKNSFDVIVAFEIIENVFDLERVLAEFRRVLRPGGTLIISSRNRLYTGEAQFSSNPYLRQGFSAKELVDLLSRHYKPPFQIYGQFQKEQYFKEGEGFHIPTITEGLKQEKNKSSSPSFQYGHAYLSEEDFIFCDKRVVEAPVLLAMCSK